MFGFQNAFISYGRADSKAFAARLQQRLVERGVKVWLDLTDIPVGVNYQALIDDGIENTDNFLFIISPHSVNSPYCLKEVEMAVRCNKRMIPLLHVEEISRDLWQQRHPQGTEADWQTYQAQGRHTSFANMHPAIAEINWIYFRDDIDDFDAALESLIAIFNQHVDYVRKHTNFLIQALDWDRQQRRSRYLLAGEDLQTAQDWLQFHFMDEPPPCLPTDLHCEYITESIKNANNLMTQVFLSYAEPDWPIAEPIRLRLMREGLTVWTSKYDVPSGTTFQTALEQGIEQADAIVYLVSPNSLESDTCQHTLDYALSLNKRVIPVLIQPTDLTQAPNTLKNLQTIDLSSHRPDAEAQQNTSQLLKVLKQDAEYYEEHKVLLAKALKWKRHQQNPTLLLRGYNLQHAETWLKVAQQRTHHVPLPLHQEFITESQRQPSGLALEVFVSYSRADSDFARRLNDALQFQDKTTWFDQESIASGTDFQQEIYRGIENCNHFLFIISPSSVRSPYCADEVEYAAKLNKRIVTVLYRPINAAELPAALAAVQWIDFNQHEGDFSANFTDLIRVLDTDRVHLQSHTRLLVRALEWDTCGRKESLLLRGDDLEQAEQWLTQSQQKEPAATELHTSYIQNSRSVEDADQKATQILQTAADKGKRRVLIGTIAMSLGLLVAGVAGIAAYRASETAREARQGTQLERNGTNAIQQFQVQELNGLVTALGNGRELNAIVGDRPLDTYPAFNPIFALQTILDTIRERNRFPMPPGETLVHTSFMPGQPQVVTIGDNGAVRVWDKTGKLQDELNLGKSLWSASSSPDGKRIAAIAKDGMLYQWTRQEQDVKSFQLGRSFKISDGKRYASVSFSPDGQRLGTLVQGSGLFTLWSLQGQRLSSFKAGGANFGFSPDGQRIATAETGPENSKIRIWNLKSQKLDREFSIPHNVFSLSFSPDGQQVFTGDGEGTIRVWTLQGKRIDQLRTPQTAIVSLGFSPDGKELVTGNRLLSGEPASEVNLWTLSKRQPRQFSTGDGVLSIAFSPDGQELLTANNTGGNAIARWTTSGKSLSPLPIPSAGNQTIVSVALSPDGKILAMVTNDGKLLISDRTGNPLTSMIPAHEGIAFSVSFSPDGQQLATTGLDGTTKLWTATGQKQGEIKGDPLAQARRAVFSPDGKQVVTASTDGLIRWWALDDKPLAQFNPHQGQPIAALSISPDGQRFATADESGTVRIWSKTQNLLAEFKFPQTVFSLSFTPDGQQLVAGGEDGTIHFIPIESLSTLLNRGCTWASDYLQSPGWQGDRSFCPEQ